MTDSERSGAYAQKFARMIRCETVSVQGCVNPEKFRPFHALLRELFPCLFSKVTAEDFSGSLLLRWPGASSDSPVLFMSHHDVVEATGNWTYPPFSGQIADGRIYGRGSLDTKDTLFAFLQAAEELAQSGFVPKNDIYFESACTEETDGSGADAISAELQKRGIRFRYVLDEGGYILHDPVGGADHDFAVVGVGEKGAANLKFTALSAGGHASMPPKNTPLVRLGKFMCAVEKSGCFKSHMNEVTKELFRRCAPYMKGALGFLFRHVGFFRPVLTLVMPLVSNAAGAMLRTTVAFTMAAGSNGANVIPGEAWVVGNMRFSHHQGQKASFDAIEKIAGKYGIAMTAEDPGFESGISDYRAEPFKNLEKAVTAVFGDVATVPYIMNGASDCRYFDRVCDNCYRFAPFKISDEQLASIHGQNENLDIAGLSKAVDFYKTLMED